MRIRTSGLRKVLGALAVGALVLVSRASAQSITFDFENGTDQGWGAKFSNDASKAFPIVTIGGSNRMEVLRTGGFQEADISSGDTTSDLFKALAAAAANEAGYQFSYDWYVDTSLAPRTIRRILAGVAPTSTPATAIIRRTLAPRKNLNSMARSLPQEPRCSLAMSLLPWLPKPLICRRPTISSASA